MNVGPSSKSPDAVSLGDLRLRAVRARIADVACATALPVALGSIRLRPHQQRAAARVAQALARSGGCLLADDVGRGKTYVALAVARRWQRPLVVVPASLRSTWQRAMERARVPCAIVTHEALSRGSLPALEPDGVIVDESHRFRSPEATRYDGLAHLTAHAPVLLLSATPLQNGTRDLAAQLAFFLGSSAFRSGGEALARHVIRTSETEHSEMPAVVPPEWLHPACDDGAVLRAILALPPPARPFDAGDAGALRTVGLVRAWASSRAALASALRRRMRAIAALEQSAVSGLSPSSRDLRAWHGVDGDVQLALAPLLVSRVHGDGGSALLAAVTAERAGLDRLALALRGASDPDSARLETLRRLRAQHPEARILAFSEFATTVRALYALLRADAGVGLLTANEARIASGRLSRDALLDRFAPAAQGAREPPPRERVSLLLSTDLLSEGVNLQDASVVVHLDLPWNPARLAQRLGRVRRPGGAAVVHSYLMAPPATTELLLQVDARLRAKLARAERAIGRTLNVLPALSAASAELSAMHSSPVTAATTDVASAEALGTSADAVACWRRQRRWPSGRRARGPLVAAVACADTGWLAALDDGRLIARVGSSPVGSSGAVSRAVGLAAGMARRCTVHERALALSELEGWLESERLTLDCGVSDVASALDAPIERRIARAIRCAPRHQRAAILALATRLRDELGHPLPLGAEREWDALLASRDGGLISDHDWLERMIAASRRNQSSQSDACTPRVVALIVLGTRPSTC
jgi:superfamily II DNA or RNA helicase